MLESREAPANRHEPPAPEAGARYRPLLSVVVPTRNEEDNIAPLSALLRDALPAGRAEVIFVDDSDDATPERVRQVALGTELPVRLVHRAPDERGDGLGGAVVEGIRAARGAWVCVMDGDLQHPPQLIDQMLVRARSGGFDLVAASRFRAGGDAAGLGPGRRALSWLSKRIAHLMFPDRLGAVSDPMSGFFLVRRAAVDVERLRPRGFKILVEILVRTPGLKVSEVGFHFGERGSGESKASAREAARYLVQLSSARLSGRPARLLRFGLVGLSGLAVNTLALAAFTSGADVYYALSAVLATQVSTAWNFALADRWVFGDRVPGRGAGRRAGLFFLTNNAAMLIRIPLLLLLTDGLGIHYLVSNVLSLLSLTLLRFLLADGFIWGEATRRVATSWGWTYDIHGIVTVESDVALPELERFHVDELVEHPAITVRTRGAARAEAPPAAGATAAAGVHYTEALRRMGFDVDIAIGERTEVRASWLLALSPHVLYTNVVEPILRWSFAERGYALVHAACVADGDRALLLTARTDTGKTTTALKLLDSGPYGFLSDDLTLLCPDGRVLAYPKPMTISRHTLHAVHAPRLNRRERVALVLQSRLHSRSGRRFALLLARTGVPAATVNAVTQILVPPPKYQVDRLVPGVRIASEARVESLVVIERGGEGEVPLASDDALATLLDNCEDAYGFPPYASIEHVLHSRDGLHLQDVERATIAGALAGVDATLLRSETMDWWSRLPGILGVAPPPAAQPAAPPPAGAGRDAVPQPAADA